MQGREGGPGGAGTAQQQQLASCCSLQAYRNTQHACASRNAPTDISTYTVSCSQALMSGPTPTPHILMPFPPPPNTHTHACRPCQSVWRGVCRWPCVGTAPDPDWPPSHPGGHVPAAWSAHVAGGPTAQPAGTQLELAGGWVVVVVCCVAVCCVQVLRAGNLAPCQMNPMTPPQAFSTTSENPKSLAGCLQGVAQNSANSNSDSNSTTSFQSHCRVFHLLTPPFPAGGGVQQCWWAEGRPGAHPGTDSGGRTHKHTRPTTQGETGTQHNTCSTTPPLPQQLLSS